VDARKNSRKAQGFRIVAAALFAAAAGAGGPDYPLAADTHRCPCPVAEWQGDMGTARSEGCLLGILLAAGP